MSIAKRARVASGTIVDWSTLPRDLRVVVFEYADMTILDYMSDICNPLLLSNGLYSLDIDWNNDLVQSLFEDWWKRCGHEHGVELHNYSSFVCVDMFYELEFILCNIVNLMRVRKFRDRFIARAMATWWNAATSDEQQKQIQISSATCSASTAHLVYGLTKDEREFFYRVYDKSADIPCPHGMQSNATLVAVTHYDQLVEISIKTSN
jgi:hypothetical protein